MELPHAITSSRIAWDLPAAYNPGSPGDLWHYIPNMLAAKKTGYLGPSAQRLPVPGANDQEVTMITRPAPGDRSSGMENFAFSNVVRDSHS